jgi:hypothetical protein
MRSSVKRSRDESIEMKSPANMSERGTAFGPSIKKVMTEKLAQNPNISGHIAPPIDVPATTPAQGTSSNHTGTKLSIFQPPTSIPEVTLPSFTLPEISRCPSTRSVGMQPAAMLAAPVSKSSTPAITENEQMQELRRMQDESKKPSCRQIGIPFKEYASAIQHCMSKLSPKESAVVRARRLFLGRVQDDVIEEARVKYGRKDGNVPAFHAGTIMLDELNMEVEEQADKVKSAESAKQALQKDLAKAQENADGLKISLALKTLEVKELEETEAALIEALDEVEDTAIEACEARNRRMPELESSAEETACLVAKLEAVNKEQEYEIAEL